VRKVSRPFLPFCLLSCVLMLAAILLIYSPGQRGEKQLADCFEALPGKPIWLKPLPLLYLCGHCAPQSLYSLFSSLFKRLNPSSKFSDRNVTLFNCITSFFTSSKSSLRDFSLQISVFISWRTLSALYSWSSRDTT
jgi:hypothetical protein